MNVALFLPCINHSLKKFYKALLEAKAFQDIWVQYGQGTYSDVTQNHTAPNQAENMVEEARNES